MNETEMIRVEFYGANGYCLECHQPLEGNSCPYCGWEDKGYPQYGYISKITPAHLTEKEWQVKYDALQAERDALLAKLADYEGENKRWHSFETVQAIVKERDALRQQLDVAKEALDKIADTSDNPKWMIADKARTEIAKLGEKK